MKKLDLSSVSATNQFPVKEGTFDFLALAYQEALTALGNNLIGDKANIVNGYRLWGCQNTGTGLNFIISAGAIYFAGEVFLVPAATFTAAGGQTAVANMVVTQYTTNADPVTFTDSVPRNVHNIRSIVFASSISGTGLFDFGNIRETLLGLKNDPQLTLGASYTVTFEQDRAAFFSSATVDTTITFDFTDAVPGTVVRMKWSYGSGRVLTINTPAGSTIVQDSGNLSAVASANNLLYFLYVGKNYAGDDEVSYTLKQF